MPDYVNASSLTYADFKLFKITSIKEDSNKLQCDIDWFNRNKINLNIDKCLEHNHKQNLIIEDYCIHGTQIKKSCIKDIGVTLQLEYLS